MEQTDLLGLPLPFWGVVIGTVATLTGVIANNWMNTRNLKFQLEHAQELKKTERLIERYEELFVLLDNWANLFVTHFLHIKLVMDGNIDYNEYLDITSKRSSNHQHEYSRIEMIIGMYCSQFRNHHKELLAARDSFNKAIDNHKSAYKIDGEPHAEHFKNVQSAMISVENAISAIQDELKREVAQL